MVLRNIGNIKIITLKYEKLIIQLIVLNSQLLKIYLKLAITLYGNIQLSIQMKNNNYKKIIIIIYKTHLCKNFARKSIKKGTLKSYSLLQLFMF